MTRRTIKLWLLNPETGKHEAWIAPLSWWNKFRESLDAVLIEVPCKNNRRPRARI